VLLWVGQLDWTLLEVSFDVHDALSPTPSWCDEVLCFEIKLPGGQGPRSIAPLLMARLGQEFVTAL